MKNILNKKKVNNSNSPSLLQGNKFDKYQNKIKKNLEKTNKSLFTEGFNDMSSLNLKPNGLTKQTINVVKQNSVNSQQQQSLNELKQQYANTLTQYETLLDQINGTTTGYLNRVNPSNPYLGKTVGFSGGSQIGYVTAQGVFKYIPSTQIQNSVNIPTTITSLNIPWNNSYSVSGTVIPTNPSLVAGTPVVQGQSFGNEGSNVYVDQLLPPNVSPTYMGCYATNSDNSIMTFIGGSPPLPEGSLQNANFTQPQIASNSYQYISSNATVPGWNFNAVLINNSTAWGFPMPYPDGNQALCIQATQTCGQWIQLVSGTYTLSFTACGRPQIANYDYSANTINVYCGQSGTPQSMPSASPFNPFSPPTTDAQQIVQSGTPQSMPSASPFNPFSPPTTDAQQIVQSGTPQSMPTVYSFTPPTTAWQKYTTTFNISNSGNYSFGFYGTINNNNNSTAIQNITISSSGSTSSGSYTYDQCKEAAIDSGYQYFALQGVNTSTSQGYCAVSNDQPSITSLGAAMVPNGQQPLWSSNTSGQTGNTATLTITGALSVLNSGGQAVYSTPNSNAQPSNYLGCYGDGPNRAMSFYNNGAQQYNNAQCQQIAQQNGSTYYGLQNSTSGTTAQCFLSNDWGQTTEYGAAGNCTQISDGSWSGGGYSNAVYNTSLPQSNYCLILTDDGNMVINRGTSPDDNQGQIWTSNTTAQQANPAFAAINGKYGENWISQGSTLAAGDFIGSPSGYVALIMQSDGNLVLYTFSMVSNCQTMKDGNIGGGIGANATYNIGVTSIPENIGNLAYVDANSEIHLYPTTNQTYGSSYYVYNNIDSTGNDIQGAAFSGTQQQCASACNANPNCAGYVTNASGSYCWPKTNSMFPYSQTGTYNSDRNTYVRTMMPESPPLGVSQNTNNTDTITYKNYVNGGSISNQYGLSQATSVQQQQLSQLQTQLNLLTQQITTITNQYENGVNELESQSQENVSGLSGYLSQLINTNDNISSTTKMNSGNLQNILSDSDIIVLQKNYSYLIWSILAVGTVLITMNIVKK